MSPSKSVLVVCVLVISCECGKKGVGVYWVWWESRQGVRHQTTSQNKLRPCVSVSVQWQTCGLPQLLQQEQGVWGQATCHRNNMSSVHHSLNGSAQDHRHGRHCVAPPRWQFTQHSHTHTHIYVHKHPCTYTHSCCPLSTTYRPRLERLGGPLYENMQGCWR